MDRIKATIAYDGTNYCGWQIQPNGVTIQETVEKAIEEVLGTKIKITASGRTDAGVHALGQVFHFDNSSTIPANKLSFAINAKLPEDIRILKTEIVSNDFHARYSAKNKTYIYKMYLGKYRNPLKRNYETYIGKEINIIPMQAAAEMLLGSHDFVGFSSSGSDVKTTVREIFNANIDRNGDELQFEITGNGFLYNMVRIIVGTLIEIGEGKKDAECIAKILNTKKRNLGGKTAKPQGLYLLKVKYL